MSKSHSSANPVDPDTKQSQSHEDDVIVVPKGSSRSRFLLTALLAVLVLTTFTVSGEVVDVLTGRDRASSAYMSWKRPDGKVEEVKQRDFVLVKQRMSKTMGLISGGRTTPDKDDGDTARHILTDRLAEEAGIAVTDQELSKIILDVFGTAEIYRRRLADYKISAKDFEQTLRSILRVQRYGVLLAQGYAQPDPQAIEKAWKEAHRQYSMETIEIPTETFAAEATAAVPAGTDLEAYFETLPEAQKSSYRKPIDTRTAAEFAWLSIGPEPTNSQKLLEKYPRPATENADDVARTWYEANKELLYLKDGLAADKAREPGDYKPFEQVQEQARTAGIAYQSLLDWYNDVKTKEAGGERTSLYQQATDMGLGYRMEGQAKTLAEWDAANLVFAGKAPVLATFEPTSTVQELLPEVFVDARALVVGRLIMREAARVPEFADYQEKVRTDWIEKRKGELAREKLAALASKFPTAPDPFAPETMVHVEVDGAKFQAAATELGLEVKTQDWLDVSATPEPAKSTPFWQFVRRSAGRYGETVGTISPPELSADRATAWMSRVAAQREADPASMTPFEYESARVAATSQARNEFLSSTLLSDDFLKQQYGLSLESWREQETPAN